MRRFLGSFFDILVELLSSGFLLVMFGVVIYGVYVRHMGTRSAFWTDELARYCMFFMVMIGSAAAIRENIHPALTFLTEGFKGKARFVVDMWVELVVLLTVALLFWAGWEMMMDARRAKTAALRIYYNRVYFAIPFGCLLMGIATLRRIVGIVVDRGSRPPEIGIN